MTSLGESCLDAFLFLLGKQLKKSGEKPLLGLILGTGLSGLAAELLTGPAAGEAPGARVAFASLPGFPLPGVDSHQGAFVLGRLHGVPVLAQQGRRAEPSAAFGIAHKYANPALIEKEGGAFERAMVEKHEAG